MKEKTNLSKKKGFETHSRIRENVLSSFYEIYDEDTTRARSLIKRLDFKNDPFLLSEIAHTYFDEGRLRLAERFSLRAFSIDYLNPSVLWILGLVKWDYGQHENAIFCFEEIIRLGTSRRAKSGSNESIESTHARINDSKLQLFRLLRNKEPERAVQYLKSYERGLKRGYFSLLDDYYQEIKSENKIF